MTFLVRRIALLLALLVAPAWLGAQEDPWFSVDALNEGLGAPSDAVDRRTPRATVASFMRAADAGRWDEAAHLLDLADTDAGAQPVEGPILARQLHSVIERKAVLDWSTIIDRPDALQVLGGRGQAQAGEPRRSLLLRELDLHPVPASVRLERVRPGEDADPVWVFSRETIADVPALYRDYGPSALEARLPSVMRTEGPWGLMWWEWIALPLLLLGAAFIAWVTAKLFDRIRRSSTHGMVRGVVRALRTPTILTAVTTLAVWVSENVFVFSGRIDTVLSPAIAIGYVTAVLMLIVNVVEAILDNLFAPGDDTDLTHSEFTEARSTATKLNAGKRILTVVVFLVGAGIVFSTADVFRGLGLSLLASAGVLAVILGFAARRVLGNILASLQIAMNQSARVGDRVMYKGELCYVERINMTFIQLRDWDDTRLIVPVEEFAYETFSNWTIQDPAMKRILKFKLRPEADVPAIREAFLGIVRELSEEDDHSDDVADLDGAKCDVVGQDVFGIDVWFFVPCTSPNTSWAVSCVVRERLIAAIRDMEVQSDQTIFPEVSAAEAA